MGILYRKAIKTFRAMGKLPRKGCKVEKGQISESSFRKYFILNLKNISKTDKYARQVENVLSHRSFKESEVEDIEYVIHNQDTITWSTKEYEIISTVGKPLLKALSNKSL